MTEDENKPCTFFSANRKVAVTPFATEAVEVTERSGFATAAQKTNLTPLEVVFPMDFSAAAQDKGSPMLWRGDTVYVRGDLCKHAFAKEVFELDGKKFILLDVSLVQLVDRHG